MLKSKEIESDDICESNDSAWNDVINKKIIKFRKELADHMAVKPGDYRPDLPFDHTQNEAFRRWVRRKVELDEFLSVFDLSLKTVKKPQPANGMVGHNVPRKLAVKDRENMGVYHATFLDCLEYLKKLTPGSSEWHAIRCRANNLKNAILKMAEKHKMEIPHPFPIVPSINQEIKNDQSKHGTSKPENNGGNTA